MEKTNLDKGKIGLAIYVEYLWQTIRHKYFVFIECWKLGIPWLGLIHDISKFHPIEFIGYSKAYKGKDKSKLEEAWFHHQKRNKHHWHYWVMIDNNKVIPRKMPEKYIKEMLADLLGFEKTIKNSKSPIEFYKQEKEDLIIHPESKQYLERIMYEDRVH